MDACLRIGEFKMVQKYVGTGVNVVVSFELIVNALVTVGFIFGACLLPYLNL